MRIRYFFTNKRDTSQNNFIWHDAPRPLRISDIKNKLKNLGVINEQSHLRFLDKIKGEKVWLDITNADVECPLNSEGIADIKILQQFHEASQSFLEDVFKGIPEDQYETAVLRLREVLLGGMASKVTHKKTVTSTQNESGYMAFQDEDEFQKSEDLNDEFGDLEMPDQGERLNKS